MIQKHSVAKIIDSDDTMSGKVFSYIINLLIIASLVTFSIDTLPDLSPEAQRRLDMIELVTVIIFTIEYVLRIWISEKKAGFIFSFYGLIDLLAVLPFYISLFYISFGFDLRAVRVFRLLRLLRILKLMKYNKAVKRFQRAFLIAREELILFGIITSIMLFISAVGIYHFENAAQPDKFQSVFHSLWWALITLTTVGYGDIFPVTLGGRLFTFFVLMIGLGIVAVPTGLISSALTQAREEEAAERN